MQVRRSEEGKQMWGERASHSSGLSVLRLFVQPTRAAAEASSLSPPLRLNSLATPLRPFSVLFIVLPSVLAFLWDCSCSFVRENTLDLSLSTHFCLPSANPPRPSVTKATPSVATASRANANAWVTIPCLNRSLLRRPFNRLPILIRRWWSIRRILRRRNIRPLLRATSRPCRNRLPRPNHPVLRSSITATTTGRLLTRR